MTLCAFALTTVVHQSHAIESRTTKYKLTAATGLAATAAAGAYEWYKDPKADKNLLKHYWNKAKELRKDGVVKFARNNPALVTAVGLTTGALALELSYNAYSSYNQRSTPNALMNAIDHSDFKATRTLFSTHPGATYKALKDLSIFHRAADRCSAPDNFGPVPLLILRDLMSASGNAATIISTPDSRGRTVYDRVPPSLTRADWTNIINAFKDQALMALIKQKKELNHPKTISYYSPPTSTFYFASYLGKAITSHPSPTVFLTKVREIFSPGSYIKLNGQEFLHPDSELREVLPPWDIPLMARPIYAWGLTEGENFNDPMARHCHGIAITTTPMPPHGLLDEIFESTTTEEIRKTTTLYFITGFYDGVAKAKAARKQARINTGATRAPFSSAEVTIQRTAMAQAARNRLLQQSGTHTVASITAAHTGDLP